MKIVFLGLNDIGSQVLEYLKSLEEDQIFLITDKSGLDKVKEIKPDLILSIGFRSIVPGKFLSIPRMGSINFHKALLPLNRGANPVFWAISNNTKAGVTIHYMDDGIDTGDIIAQREFEYDFDDTAKSLYENLEKMQLELFKEVWPDIRAGRNERIKQKGPSTYHEIKDFKKCREIDLNAEINTHQFVDLLRAMTFPPFNNSFFFKNGKKYFVEIHISREDEMSEKEGTSTLLKQYK